MLTFGEVRGNEPGPRGATALSQIAKLRRCGHEREMLMQVFDAVVT